MKCLLIGYPGSQCIVPASKYLTDKYLPQKDDFDITFINYEGGINGWASFVAETLSMIGDENIIFSLDDYLIAGPIDLETYRKAEAEIGGDVVCVKLCKSTLREHEEYPVTTQWTIWNREYLIGLLRKVNTPWQFEINGSKLFDKKVLLRTCLDYFTNSSISTRWDGINLAGLKENDIKYLKQQKLL